MYLLNSNNGEVIQEIVTAYRSIDDVNFSSNGNLILVTNQYNGQNASSVYTLKGTKIGLYHGRPSLIAPNEKYVITRGPSGGASYYQIKNLNPDNYVFMPKKSWWGAHAQFTGISDNSQYWFVTTGTGIEIGDENGNHINKLKIRSGVKGTGTNFEAAYFIPNTTWIFTLTKSHGAVIWDIDGKVICKLGDHSESRYSMDPVIISKNGCWILVNDSNKNYLYCLNYSPFNKLAKVLEPFKIFSGERAYVTPNEKLILIHDENKIKIWTLDGRLVKEFSINITPVDGLDQISISPNGDYFFYIYSNDSYSVWTIKGKEISKVRYSKRSVPYKYKFYQKLIPSTNIEKYYTSFHEKELDVWHAKDSFLYQVTHKSIDSNPYKYYIYPSTPGEKKAQEKELEEDKAAKNKPKKRSIDGGVFSLDGEYLLTYSRTEDSVRLWNSQGENLITLDYHYFKALDARENPIAPFFSNNAKVITTLTSDSTCTAWNIKGQEMFTFNLGATILKGNYSIKKNLFLLFSRDF